MGLILSLKKKGQGAVGKQSSVGWLISCKHKDHSGNSVNPIDDANIISSNGE